MAIRFAEVAVLITLVILWHVPIPRAKDRLPSEPEGATEAAIKRGGNGPRMLVRLWHNRNGKRRATCAERIKERHNEGACKSDAVKGTALAYKAGSDSVLFGQPCRVLNRKSGDPLGSVGGKSERFAACELTSSLSRRETTSARSRQGPAALRVIRFEGVGNAVESVGIWTIQCPLIAALANSSEPKVTG